MAGPLTLPNRKCRRRIKDESRDFSSKSYLVWRAVFFNDAGCTTCLTLGDENSYGGGENSAGHLKRASRSSTRVLSDAEVAALEGAPLVAGCFGLLYHQATRH